ncbi:MAG: hypothetical protein KIT35_16645 [Piscinibacter sp.]|uniref:hypothetical protein n=1 Tax=Piscinibacter sp. TaxID=1903157 RepID=UPI002585BE3F|nr:hypothetical protein [Piscinibacter sp.]MCW5665463.1 hypothetical protein [Piscinibacter sp.]
MPSNSKNQSSHRNARTRNLKFESPLLRILVAEAARRGWTLAHLARQLDLTYERLAQYRRADADIANASRATMAAAASLLGIPLAGVYVLAGKVKPEDFLWPNGESVQEHIRRNLERLASDPFYGPFTSDELMRADIKVQFLVSVLYRELSRPSLEAPKLPTWLEALHKASIGSERAEDALAELRREPSRTDLF